MFFLIVCCHTCWANASTSESSAASLAAFRSWKITSCHCNYHWSYLHPLSIIQNHQPSKSPSIFQNHQSIFAISKKTSPPTSFPVQTQTPTKKRWVRFLLTKTVCSFQAVIRWKPNTSGCNTCHPSHLDVSGARRLKMPMAKKLRSNMKGHSYLQRFPLFIVPGILWKTTRIWPSNWFNVWQNSFTTCSILVLPLKINSVMLPASVRKEN